MRAIRCFALLCALLLAGCAPAWDIGPAQTPYRAYLPAVRRPAVKRHLVALINQERAAHGLLALAEDSRLTAAAQYHAEDMRNRDYFDHDTLDGPTWSERIRRYYQPWHAIGENIAAGQPDERAVLWAWMDSPPHRGLILDANGLGYVHVGIGVASGGRYGHYWVMDVGEP